jgi:hypothetical protein
MLTREPNPRSVAPLQRTFVLRLESQFLTQGVSVIGLRILLPDPCRLSKQSAWRRVVLLEGVRVEGLASSPIPKLSVSSIPHLACYEPLEACPLAAFNPDT